jgi:hypothetical protein
VTDLAQIVHTLPGRTRFRIPARRHDAAYFARLDTQLRQLAGVSAVTSNPTTASVLVLHMDSAQQTLLDYLGQSGWISSAVAAAPSSARWESASPQLATWFPPAFPFHKNDMRIGLVLLLLTLAARQIMRGEIMIPAASLLWYALEAAAGLPPSATDNPASQR